MQEVIIDTRPDGTVAITTAAEECIVYLKYGLKTPWHPWGAFQDSYWAVQFQRKVARGVKPNAAYKFCRGIRDGGLSRREALEVIADYSVGHLGTAIEIVDVSEVPDDRTYRDAWRRSSNGGPIWIDETVAQTIDEERMWREHDAAA